MEAGRTADIALEAATQMDRRLLSELERIVPLIWPHHARSMLPWKAVEQFLSTHGTGAIFAIVDRSREVIGTTGWYWRPDNPTNAGLRWTGIVPAARRNGYFRTAITRVQAYVARAKPDVRSLSEIIPLQRADELVPIFLRLGFETVPDFTEERTLRVQGTDLLVDGILMTKELDASRPKISELMKRSPTVAGMFLRHPLSSDWANRTLGQKSSTSERPPTSGRDSP